MRHCGECQYGPGARETGHLFYTHFKGAPTSLGPFIAEQTALDICPPHSRLKQMCKVPSILERKFSVLEEGLADITWMVKSGQLRAWYCLKVSNSILSTRRTRLIPLSHHRNNRGYRWVGPLCLLTQQSNPGIKHGWTWVGPRSCICVKQMLPWLFHSHQSPTQPITQAYFGGVKGVGSQVRPGNLRSDPVFWYEKGIIGTPMYNT